MPGGLSVRPGDLERVAARLGDAVAEVGSPDLRTAGSGRAEVDAALAVFDEAWSGGLGVLVNEAHGCAGQVRACAATYAEADARAAALLRRGAR